MGDAPSVTQGPNVLRSQTRRGGDFPLLRSRGLTSECPPPDAASAERGLEGCGTARSPHASSTVSITQLSSPGRAAVSAREQMHRRVTPAPKLPHKWHQMVLSADHIRLLTLISQQIFQLLGVARSCEQAGGAGSGAVGSTAPPDSKTLAGRSRCWQSWGIRAAAASSLDSSPPALTRDPAAPALYRGLLQGPRFQTLAPGLHLCCALEEEPCVVAIKDFPSGTSSQFWDGVGWFPVSPVDSLRGWRSHPGCPERTSWPLLLLTVLLLCPQMLSCLEHMYHDLGLVRDFGINPITLKRWLVSVRPPVPPTQFHGNGLWAPS